MNIKTAFTLLELLIVIAVIIIMAVILLSALGKEKQQTTGILCISNLKNCGLSFGLYAGDFNSYTPPEYDAYGDSHTWDRKLYDLEYIKQPEITKCAAYSLDIVN